MNWDTASTPAPAHFDVSQRLATSLPLESENPADFRFVVLPGFELIPRSFRRISQMVL